MLRLPHLLDDVGVVGDVGVWRPVVAAVASTVVGVVSGTRERGVRLAESLQCVGSGATN